MSDLRTWAWKDGWTQGKSIAFIPYTWFHKDETALLNPPKEVLFFQAWEADMEARDSWVCPESDQETWYSGDYDLRWRWTTVLMPNCIGHGNAHPLDWKTIEDLRTQQEAEQARLSMAVLET